LAEILKDVGALDAALKWALLLSDGTNFPESARKATPGGLENLIGYIHLLKGQPQASLEWFEKSIEKGRIDGWPERNSAQAQIDLKHALAADSLLETAYAKATAYFKNDDSTPDVNWLGSPIS
jgi:tetratricopeptide (TPR) repeat protein